MNKYLLIQNENYYTVNQWFIIFNEDSIH